MNFKYEPSVYLSDLAWMADNASFDTKEVDNTKVYTMDIPGVSASKVKVNKKWINKSKTLKLTVNIDRGEDKPEYHEINIDTDVYEKYSYKVADGVLTITLYEIINEEPKFELIEG